MVARFRGAIADPELRPLVLVFLIVPIAFSGVTIAFVPFVADVYGYHAAWAGLLLTYIGVLGALNQSVVVERSPDGSVRRRWPSVAPHGFRSRWCSSPSRPTSVPSFPDWRASPGRYSPCSWCWQFSTGNGLLSVGTTTMVSNAASEAEQGSAFGVTEGAGSLGCTVGPPIMTAIYVFAFWAPFPLGAVLTAGVVAALVAIVGRDVVSR